MSAQMLEVSIRSRNGALSRKGCVVNGQMAKASNKWVPPCAFGQLEGEAHAAGVAPRGNPPPVPPYPGRTGPHTRFRLPHPGDENR